MIVPEVQPNLNMTSVLPVIPCSSNHYANDTILQQWLDLNFTDIGIYWTNLTIPRNINRYRPVKIVMPNPAIAAIIVFSPITQL